MTRIPLIAITLSLLVPGGCSTSEAPSDPSASSTSITSPEPEVSGTHVRTLPTATFTDESREVFCAAIQDAIDKRGTFQAGVKKTNGETSEFDKASRYITEVAAPEEAEAWREVAQYHTNNEKMETPENDRVAFYELYDDLELTVMNECELAMP